MGAQDVEIGLVVAEPFEVLDAGASGQEVVGEVEDVVGFKVGNVSFEQVDLGIESVGQFQAPATRVRSTRSGSLLESICVQVIGSNGPRLRRVIARS